MNERTNRDRVKTAEAALSLYDGADDERVIDLLADLLHLCEWSAVDFEKALALARMHCSVERDGP